MSLLSSGSLAARVALVGLLLGGPSSADASANATEVSASADASATVAAYSEEVAKQFLGLSLATYCHGHDWFDDDPIVSLSAWTCGPACQQASGVQQAELVDTSNSGFALVAKMTDGACVVAFQGSASLQTALADLASMNLVKLENCTFQGKDCQVGAGILASYNDMKKSIIAKLRTLQCSDVAVTGHSLGAAQAILAMFDLRSQGFAMRSSYTFGQPVVGDSTFHAAFGAALGSTPIFRVTHGADVIVHLGPCSDDGLTLHHEGVEVFYAGGPDGGYQICSEDMALTGCSTTFLAQDTGVDFAADFSEGTCWTKVIAQVGGLLISHPEVKDDHLKYLGQSTGAEANCCPKAAGCEASAAFFYP